MTDRMRERYAVTPTEAYTAVDNGKGDPAEAVSYAGHGTRVRSPLEHIDAKIDELESCCGSEREARRLRAALVALYQVRRAITGEGG